MKFTTLLFLCFVVTMDLCDSLKGSADKSNMAAIDSTIISLSKDFPKADFPISALHLSKKNKSCYLEWNVYEVNNPNKVPIQILISTGLNDNMVLIGTFSLFPSDLGGKFLVDITPYMDILCSGNTRDLKIEVLDVAENQSPFQIKVSVKPNQ